MCLILFAYQAHPRYPLIVAANRDEWFRRPSAPARFWPDAPQVLGGRDLQQHGTWLGLDRFGRFAAITNFRDPASMRTDAPSRGAIVGDYLKGGAALTPEAYARQLNLERERFNGFNLLIGDAERLVYLSNREPEWKVLRPGNYGLSNHLLDTEWPKVKRGKAGLGAVLGRPAVSPGSLFELLADRTLAGDIDLPSTGVATEWERALSAMHIVAGDYGTRCATVLLISAEGRVHFAERSFDAKGEIKGAMSEEFRLAA